MPASGFLLIFANIVPVMGVLYGGWNILDLLFIYWAESVIIGFFNILKMLSAGEKNNRSILLIVVDRLFACSFFIVCYGGFMLLHAVFIFGLAAEFYKISFEPLALLAKTWPGLLSLFFSHGFSFISNYLLSREREKADIYSLMHQPYSRIVTMQISLIIGLWLTTFFGQPALLLLFFLIMKTAADLNAHLKERKKFKPAHLHPALVKR
jgi:cation transport ATPase